MLTEYISEKQDLTGQEKVMLLQYISKAKNQFLFFYHLLSMSLVLGIGLCIVNIDKIPSTLLYT